MNVTLSQLRVFVTLCDTLHFRHAAQRLSVTQPAVSKELRALEKTLGLRLLSRSSVGTTLTEEGRQIEPLARALVTQVATLESRAAEVRRQSNRQVTIAASPSIVNRILPETLRQVDDMEMGIGILALEVETGEVVDAVDGGRADIGIGHHLSEPTRAIKRHIGDDELRILVSPALVHADRRSIDMARLANVPLLLWPRERNPAYFDAMLEACRVRGLDPLVLTGTSRISGSWSYFLDDARAFALAPLDFAEQEAGAGLVSIALQPPAQIPLEIVWREGNAAVNDVLEIILAVTADRRRRRPPIAGM